ncbi:MAG: Sec-independent protein translocase protein TatB [Panacagrimonas sp.]
MFDISFGELALCFLVALVVLGPEKLPKVARTVGRWAGNARAYMRNLSTELEKETQVMDIKRQLQEAKQALHEAEATAERETRALSQDATQDLNRKL